ncbi:MAG: porphobilinogen synthase [Candidatus Micrarchaeia archaeon]
MFPETRLRRLRGHLQVRRLVRGTSLSPDNFILPVFFKENTTKPENIPNMPGVFRQPLKNVDKIAQECEDNKIPCVLIFGIPRKKDAKGSVAFAKNGVVQKAIRKLNECSSLAVFADACLCQYTTNGHCGITNSKGVNNDASLKLLEKIALSQANAGADFIAPSAMMDGQVKAIRNCLDKNGFENTGIMSYSAKFASAFYSPFRSAVQASPKKQRRKPFLRDRTTHQLDFYSTKQAMQEIESDLCEGADIAMIKPALPYLDVIAKAKEKFSAPLAAYQVSGEYALLKSGILHSRHALLESTIAIKRAGADIIISYAAVELLKQLKDTQ